MPTNTEQVWTVERVEELLSRITPPPWTCNKTYRFVGADAAAICNPRDDVDGARMYQGNRKNNAEFIAAAPEIIRWLLDENAELREALAAAQADNSRLAEYEGQHHEQQ